MRHRLLAAAAFLCFANFGFAVYAPIPEQDQGKPLTFSLAGGVYYDSNIFGGPTAEIDSLVYQLIPRVNFNASVTPQMFVSAGYTLSIDHVENRPGSQTLFSHDLNARVAHAFSEKTFLDVSDVFTLARNPESLLAGLPLNTDQSFKRNQADLRFSTAIGARLGTVLKLRRIDFQFDDPLLSTQLDRSEHLAGLEGNFSLLPEWKIAFEYRYQTIGYETSPESKDKDSHFALLGADYAAGEKLLLTARAGLEERDREGGPDGSSPYVELSANYNYGPTSFLNLAYNFTTEETANVLVYTDTEVNRLLATHQHRLTDLVALSTSLTYENSVLSGRAGFPNAAEQGVRAGLGVAYFPANRLAVIATLDYDVVWSDDPGRDLKRTRAGLSARYSF